ncbi:MAG: small multi-drug export protein [Clostridia bacterium]|nr:small multi-drug export protein [Clostridia bacterium]
MASLPLFIKFLLTGFVGILPIIELRGAIPVGVFTFHLSYIESFICSFIGNIIPVYFIVKYIRPLFDFFRRWKIFAVIIDWASEKATKHIESNEKLQNAVSVGLFLFVAIPLPGTGAWVGSLIANFLNVPPKKAIPPIILGVLTAGIIVLALTAMANGGIQYLLQKN